jgi:hypothetical protein
LIGRTELKDSIEMTSTEGDALSLRLTHGYRREFEIHLIESTSGALPLPKLNLDVRLVMKKASFEGVLTDFWQPALPSPLPTTWSEPHRMQIGLLPGHPSDLSVASTLSHSWGRVEEKVTIP